MKPLGIFWDIENCPIPDSKSPFHVPKVIRDFIIAKHPECEFEKRFVTVVDAKKTDQLILEALNKNGLDVLTVNSLAKNAADFKLMDKINDFLENFKESAVLCIISSDINFQNTALAARRNKHHVILIHGPNCSDQLKVAANECFLFKDVIKNAEKRSINDSNQLKEACLVLTKLPNLDKSTLHNELSKLSDNCGGKPIIMESGTTYLKYGSEEFAKKSLNKIKGMKIKGKTFEIKLGSDSDLEEIKKYFTEKTKAKKSQPNQKPLIDKNLENFPDLKSETALKFGRYSVLKGIPTNPDDDLTQVVKRLVSNWNDSNLKTDFIKNVERSYESKVSDGITNLFIESPDQKSCNALIEKSTVYLKEKAKWEKFFPPECKSIMKGMTDLKSGQDLKEFVKTLISQWNVKEINPNFIEKVEKDNKYKGNFVKTLFITASSPKNNDQILRAVVKHKICEKGIKWHYPIKKNIATSTSK